MKIIVCRAAVVALALASVVLSPFADDQSVAIVPQVITDTTGYVTLTTDDPGGNYSYNTAGRWSDHAAPSSGKDYLVQNNYVIRFQTGTFAGRSLTLDNGRAKVGLANMGTATVNDSRLYGGRIEDSAANVTENMAGTFRIYGTAANPSRISGCSGRVSTTSCAPPATIWTSSARSRPARDRPSPIPTMRDTSAGRSPSAERGEVRQDGSRRRSRGGCEGARAHVGLHDLSAVEEGSATARSERTRSELMILKLHHEDVI